MFQRIWFWMGLLLTCHVVGAPAPLAAVDPSREATAEELALLNSALENTARDLRRWAYTETRVIRGEKGKIKSEVVVRYDPSKPWAEQWTPVTLDQKPPTKSQLEKYRKMGLRDQKFSEHPETDKRRTLGDSISLVGSRVVSETAEQIVFEVPLKKDNNDRFPPEKFEVLVRINKAARALENIAVKLRSSFRMKLIVKAKSGEATLDFGQVNPKYPPTLLSIHGNGSASIMFVSVGGEVVLKRTDLKHVKPFDERFDVQIGPLKALDF